jgi:hypothetical protein
MCRARHPRNAFDGTGETDRMSRSTSLRSALVAIATAMALVAISVGQVFASGGSGPFPK